MERPVSKPSDAEIAAMKEAGRQEFRDNKARVIEHLKGKGLSNAAIAGIVGNIEIETGGSFDFTQKQTRSGDPRSPETVEGGGYGLFQFDDPRNKAGHETWYKDYLKQTDKEDSTESQLDYFLDMVMAGEDNKDPFYKYSSNMGAGNAGVIKAYLETNQNPSQISDAITDRFEKASIKHSDRRRKAAEATFAELQPNERADIDPNDQFIDQPGEIADTGDSMPMEEESKFENVPFLRHFFAEGGAVPMERQMEMFEEGGLMDEGGTVDPVSGNDVPPGSTQEEVRDDIPAQLSEGEFVIPADVVRYIGLGNLMQMRQEAKMGLKLMEEMGQMGNSEEATIPDDLPFDINDLDMEDEAEYNVGGFVPGTQQQQQFGISGFQQAAAPTTGVAQPPVQAASQQFVQPTARPQQAAVPTMKQYKPAEVPTFEQTIGSTPGQYDELRTYKNEAGMTMQIPFKNGQPIYPIPEGYKFVDPEATKTEDVKTTPTTPQTATVTQREEDPTEPVDPVKMQRMKDRIQAARDLGYLGADEFTNAGIFAGLTGKGEAGTVTGVGYVLDGKGNLFDPLNGHIVNTNIVSAISRDFDEFRLSQNAKNSLRSAEAQKTEFGKDMYDRMVKKGINNRFDDYMKQAIDSGGSESENAAARQYVMNVKEAVEEQAKKGNVGTDGRIINPAETARGKVSVARDSARSLAKAPLTSADDIPSTSYATAKAQRDRNAAKTEQPDITLGKTPTSNDDPPPPPPSRERGEGSSDAARSYSMSAQSRGDSFTREAVRDVSDRVASGRGFQEGGFVKKKHSKTPEQQAAIAIAKKGSGKKRGGLASKK